MPSEFDAYVNAFCAPAMQQQFAERTEAGAVDDEAVVYVAPNSKRRKLEAILGSIRTTDEFESEEGRVEGYRVKRKVRDITVHHGKSVGKLEGPVHLKGEFELGKEVWSVQEILSEGPVMTTATLVFVEEMDRSRLGAQ